MAEVRHLPYCRTGAPNVIAGWLGIRIPDPPRQRNRTRASYRKTGRKVAFVPQRRAA